MNAIAASKQKVQDMVVKAVKQRVAQSQRKIVEEQIKEVYNKITLLENYAAVNYENCIKLAKQHDRSSDHSYDAQHLLRDKSLECLFHDSEKFEAVQGEVVQLYADLFAITDKKAKSMLLAGSSPVKSIAKQGNAFMAGVAIVFLFSLVEFIVYIDVSPNVDYQTTKI